MGWIMALVVNTNVSSLVAQKSVAANQSSLNSAMERLSTGKRINSAADDAAGLSIASRMESQVRGLNQAVRNANDGISLVQAADGAMEEISAMLQRMRELAVQSTNGTLDADDRSNLQDEVGQLSSEIDRIVGSTTFNNKTLLDGSYGTNLQIGKDAGQTLNVDIANMGSLSLGGISGATNASAITSASAQGAEASVTESRFDFTANDAYEFSLTVTVDGNEYTYVVDAEVENGSAKQIVDAINDSLTGKPDATLISGTAVTGSATTAADLSSIIDVSYNGRQVTVKNLQGGAIKIDAGSTITNNSSAVAISGSVSSGGGQIYVSSVNGGTGSASGLIGDARFANTSLSNTNTAAYEAEVATATPGSAELTFTSGTSFAVVTGDTIDVTVSGTTVTVTASASGVASFVSDVKDALSATAALADFTFAAASAGGGTAGTLTVTRADGADFSIDIAPGTGSVTVGDFTISDTGATAVTQSAGDASVSITGGEVVTSGSPGGVMYFDILGNDDYEFTFATSGGTAISQTISVTYDGTASSLEDAAATIKAGLASAGSAYNFDVTAVDGRIKIVEQEGTAYKLSNFASVGAGRVVASVEAGQGASGIDSVILDDTSYASSFTTEAAGLATATKAKLSVYGETDTYSFTISDGTATATVNATQLTATAGDTTAAAQNLYNAVSVALARAGLDDVISITEKTANTAGNAAGDVVLELTHKLGYTIDIADFSSAADGQMLVSMGSGTSGTAAYLNDNLNGIPADSVVAAIDISTANGASDALSVLDRAIADVDSQRSMLGSIENRLGHTVNNLTNISVNTSAAQSRIQDADYALEAANLAKSQIMQQAASAMLAQANAQGQTVLSLLG